VSVGRIAAPFWQGPVYRPPLPGDDLLLVGAGGLLGLRDDRIVSRVSRRKCRRTSPRTLGSPAGRSWTSAAASWRAEQRRG
jgi:hypothetical protein